MYWSFWYNKPNFSILSLLSSDVSVLCDSYFRETDGRDVQIKCEWFINNLWNVYRRCCPKKTKILSLKRLLNLWITDNINIRRMVNFKHKLFKQYKNRIIAFETFNNSKSNLQRMMKRAKRDYFVRRLNNCKNNVKKTWKIVNSLLSKPNKKKCTTLLDWCDADAEVHDSRDVANVYMCMCVWPLFHHSRQTWQRNSEDRYRPIRIYAWTCSYWILNLPLRQSLLKLPKWSSKLIFSSR